MTRIPGTSYACTPQVENAVATTLAGINDRERDWPAYYSYQAHKLISCFQFIANRFHRIGVRLR